MLAGILLGVVVTIFAVGALLVGWAAAQNSDVRENLAAAGRGLAQGTLSLLQPWSMMLAASGAAVYLDRRAAFDPLGFAVGLFVVLWIVVFVWGVLFVRRPTQAN